MAKQCLTLSSSWDYHLHLMSPYYFEMTATLHHLGHRCLMDYLVSLTFWNCRFVITRGTHYECYSIWIANSPLLEKMDLHHLGCFAWIHHRGHLDFQYSLSSYGFCCHNHLDNTNLYCPYCHYIPWNLQEGLHARLNHLQVPDLFCLHLRNSCSEKGMPIVKLSISGRGAKVPN